MSFGKITGPAPLKPLNLAEQLVAKTKNKAKKVEEAPAHLARQFNSDYMIFGSHSLQRQAKDDGLYPTLLAITTAIIIVLIVVMLNPGLMG
jgi:hypothetical protein